MKTHKKVGAPKGSPGGPGRHPLKPGQHRLKLVVMISPATMRALRVFGEAPGRVIDRAIDTYLRR